MKLDVMTKDAHSTSKVDLPPQFAEEARADLVKRAVEAIQANTRQPYGAKEGAGMRASARISKRRRDYKTSYGHGISRTPRKALSHRGTRFSWVGAVAPNTVGGRRSHPPKPFKVWEKKINDKERRKAIRSAMSATMQRTLVEKRGHIPPASYPFVLDASFESTAKAKDFVAMLTKLGFENELARSDVRKVRAGRGKMRGRRYKSAKGPLIVVSGKCPLRDAASNVPGIDVCIVDKLNADVLAPGADIGRLTLFTQKAIERLAKEGLFLPGYKGPAGKGAKAAEAKPAMKAAKAKTAA